MNSTESQLYGGTKWKLGTFFGNPVYIQPMFLILIAVFSFSGISSYSDILTGLILVPILIFSVVFHELAHATTSKFFGFGSSTIILHGFGGVSINHTNKYRAPLKSSMIAAAGPISSALLGIIGLILAHWVIPTLPFSQSTILIIYSINYSFTSLNFILAAFNALPILPMDGGMVLKHVLHHFTKNEYKATKWTVYVSLTTLVLVFLPLFLYFKFGIFAAVIAGMLFFQNLQLLRSL